MVLGGKLLTELTGGDDQTGSKNFRKWLLQARRFGFVIEPEGDVHGETVSLEATVDQRGNALCRSNDTHVLALARVSGARLLFANDGALIEDFQDNDILRRPSGKVYPTTNHHGFLYNRVNQDLCSGMRYA